MGASFRSASRFVRVAREICKAGYLTGCSEGIIRQRHVLTLRDEVDLVQSTPDAHDWMLCCLFKARLHTGDTPRHRTLPVSTNSGELGAPHWINYVQNLGAEVELGLSGLVDKQRNCDDVNICQLPVLGTKNELAGRDTTCPEHVQRQAQSNSPRNHEESRTSLDSCKHK